MVHGQIKTSINASQLQDLPFILRGQNSTALMLKPPGQPLIRDFPLNFGRANYSEKATEGSESVLKRGNHTVDPPYHWIKRIIWHVPGTARSIAISRSHAINYWAC